MSEDLTTGSKITLATIVERLKQMDLRISDGFERIHDDLKRVVSTANDHENRIRSVESMSSSSDALARDNKIALTDHEARMRKLEEARWKNAGIAAAAATVISLAVGLLKAFL